MAKIEITGKDSPEREWQRLHAYDLIDLAEFLGYRELRRPRYPRHMVYRGDSVFEKSGMHKWKGSSKSQALEIGFRNFRAVRSEMVFHDPIKLETKPKVLLQKTYDNRDGSSPYEATFSFDETVERKTWRSTHHTFSWEVSQTLSVSGNVGVAGVETSRTITFGGEHGWENGEETTHRQTVNDAVTVKVEPHMLTEMTFLSNVTGAEIPFTAEFEFSAGLELWGFVHNPRYANGPLHKGRIACNLSKDDGAPHYGDVLRADIARGREGMLADWDGVLQNKSVTERRSFDRLVDRITDPDRKTVIIKGTMFVEDGRDTHVNREDMREDPVHDDLLEFDSDQD